MQIHILDLFFHAFSVLNLCPSLPTGVGTTSKSGDVLPPWTPKPNRLARPTESGHLPTWVAAPKNEDMMG